MRGVSIGQGGTALPSLGVVAGSWATRSRDEDEAAAFELDGLLPSPKTPKAGESANAATSSRNASIDVDDSCHAAVMAVDGHQAAAAAKAHSDVADDDGSSDDSEDEDASLIRMLHMRRASTSPNLRRSLGGGSSAGHSANRIRSQNSAPAPSTPQTPPVAPAPVEEGWDSVGSAASRRSRRTCGGSGKPTPNADSASSCAKNGDGCVAAGDPSDDDGGFADLYNAAKDSSRRVHGKHGYSVKQTVQRNYARDARAAQRGR